MTKTISFHLQKGGVGKTTISGTLACQSALDGFSTLLIDVDPQGNASSWFLKETPAFELADVVQGKCYSADAIIPVTQIPNLYMLPTFGIGGSLKNYAETKLAEEPRSMGQSSLGNHTNKARRIQIADTMSIPIPTPNRVENSPSNKAIPAVTKDSACDSTDKAEASESCFMRSLT